jgi:site-specific recombinase XerD
MFESIYKCPKKLASIKQCWLHDPLHDFLAKQLSQGYSKSTLAGQAYMLFRFAAFTKEHGAAKIEDLPRYVKIFVKHFEKKITRQKTFNLIGRFFQYLTEKGLLSSPKPKMPAPRFFKYVSAYAHFLREQRGLSEKSIDAIESYCKKFLLYIYDSGCNKMGKLNRSVIRQFIVTEGKHYSRQTMQRHCSTLRGFLEYLYSSNKIRAPFSTMIIMPKIYRHEKCPRFLKDDEIRAMLSSVDRNTAIGKRDFAILLILSNYGLRGIEIARLRLDDIEWRSQKIYIRRRKADNNSVYPLTPSVANAIVAYLKESRRNNSVHRQLFLNHMAPFRPITTIVVRDVVQKHLRLAGLDTEGRGAHALRYSCAQRLFEEEFSIKVIGDYLGHRSLDTTQRYMKIDIKHLREVALNDGEDLL